MDLAPPLHVGRSLASVLRPERRGLKEQLIRGLWIIQARKREGYGMWGEPGVAEAGMMLQQPEACPNCSPGEDVPGSRDPGSGGLHRLLGGEVWIRGGVLAHRCLAGCSSSISFSCPSLVSVLIAVGRAHL